MGNNTASEEEFEVEKVERGQWVKWTVPLVLLVLVLALVTAAILSERPRTALDNRNIVLCVLTALLCTLVAVSLTLMGCAESSSQTEQHIRSVATEVTTSRNELLRLGQAGLRGNEEISTKTSRLEENQRLLRDKLGELKNSIERKHNALHKTAQSHKQELAESIGAVTVNQQTMQARIDGLQQAGELMSEKITVTADNQESLRSTVQEQSELLGDRMSALAAIQEQLDSKLNTAAISLTKITDEQASLGGTLRDNTCTLTEKMQVIEQFQQTFRAEVGNVAQASQQMMASIEAMIVEQSSLREKIIVTSDNQESLRSTVQEQSELLGGRMSALAAIQEQLRGNVDGLRELMQTVAGNVTNIAHEQAALHETVGAQQVASRELFHAHAEALDAQMSSLAAAQEQLDSKLNTAAISLTKITDEQASLGGTLRDNTCTLTQKMQVIEQFQQTFQAEVSNVTQASQQMMASIEAMAVEQSSLREMTGTKNDELAGQIIALSENQKAALVTLNENLQQAAAGVGSIAGRQDNIENAINANRQESLGKLVTITHTQEHWGQQLDTTEAQVHMTMETISRLQEQVTAILAMLNTCIQSVTDLLDSDNKHQVQLEETINQNLTAITGLVSQIQGNRVRRSRFKGIGLVSKSKYQGWCVPSMYV